ncbi:metallophosphoesterase family protein [Aquimarina sp. 2201CG5-10]|uniref:metallophosphoesterase family protein n=1 Tax=Aquimarina callyspongiae TaxID=3098150 RepID=UPI002AB39A54|nr:metallophosphoesterase [Aquimarina sp. 2201CG5-10]MDY8135512.1 metallophosphoesterase [Aquimarina sp. 2201CG5-10]
MNKKIAYITDIHLDEQFPKDQEVDCRKNLETILNDISARGINSIVFGGDIGEKSSNQWFFQYLEEYDIDISLGNHDTYKEVIKYYAVKDTLKQKSLHYTKEDDLYKYIFLDSSQEFIDDDQFNWFKRELSTHKNIILFIHHPILEVNTEVDKRFALLGRDRIKNVLLNFEKDVTIFSGHYHLEDKSTISNITQYITPAGAFQVEKITDEIKINNKTFGYRIITLNEKEIDTDVVLFESI